MPLYTRGAPRREVHTGIIVRVRLTVFKWFFYRLSVHASPASHITQIASVIGHYWVFGYGRVNNKRFTFTIL